jgi:hypothetical protein
MCMEASLGTFLYSYLYLKLAKTLCLSFCLLRFLLNKIGKEGRRKWGVWGGVGGVAQTMYTHMNKWINNLEKEIQWTSPQKENCRCACNSEVENSEAKIKISFVNYRKKKAVNSSMIYCKNFCKCHNGQLTSK